MKKKHSNLTHYTKKLKKVRLARSITIIAALMVAGVVVAANVIPQTLKTKAAYGNWNDPANFIIPSGLARSTGYTDGNLAKQELIQKAYNGGDAANGPSAKALYESVGITQADINKATFQWIYQDGAQRLPNVPDGGSTNPYVNWHAFGRNNDAGFTPYMAGGTKFYYKPFSWSIDVPGVPAREPILKGVSSTGIQFFIDLPCGNLVVERTTNPTPKAVFLKSLYSINSGGKETVFAPYGAAARNTAKAKVGDIITWRLYGVNQGQVSYDNFDLADLIHDGLQLTRQGANAWPGNQVEGFKQLNYDASKPAGQQYFTPPSDGSKPDNVVKWHFGKMNVGANGYTDLAVKVTKPIAQACNSAIWTGRAGGQTNQDCVPVENNKPSLQITKKTTSNTSNVKINDPVTYQIVLKNTGTAAAPRALAIDVLQRDKNNKLTQSFSSLGSPSFTDLSGKAVTAPVYHAVKDAAAQKTYFAGNPDAFGYEIDSMPAGTQITFSITTKALILPQACDFAIGNYQNSGNDIAVTGTPAICVPVIDTSKPQISVEKTAISPRANTDVALGDTINYRVTIKNTGQSSATNVTFKDTLPNYVTGATEVNHTFNDAARGYKSTKTATGYEWSFTELKPGASGTIDLKVTVANNAPDGQQLCNVAEMTTTVPGDNTNDNKSQVCHRATVIKKSKTAFYVNRKDANGNPLNANDSNNAARAGDVIEYTLTTTNKADAEVKDFAVIDESISDILAYADVSDLGGATLKDGVLAWPAVNIPAKGTITNKFKVTLKSPIPNDLPSASDPQRFDYNMYNYYGNDVNVPVEKPFVQRIIDVASSLPETGAVQYGLIMLFVGMAVYFYVRNRQLTSELAAATVEYQHSESAGAMSEAKAETATSAPQAPTTDAPQANVIHPEPEDKPDETK